MSIPDAHGAIKTAQDAIESAYSKQLAKIGEMISNAANNGFTKITLKYKLNDY